MSNERDGPRAPEALVAAGDDEGVLILNGQGGIESASPGAVNLLFQATGHPLSAGLLRTALAGNTAELLRRLTRAVGAALHGKSAKPPAGIVHNEFGVFKLRAYALDAFTMGAPQRVSLHIERQAPMSLRLFSAPRFLSLPARERDVALRLLHGRSYPETAADLGIGQNSVVYYVRSLFRRLNIDSREQLLPALLG